VGSGLAEPGGVELTDRSTAESRFVRLHEEHFEAVRRYAWRRDPDVADDVAAETFVVAWRRLDDVPADARPWLIGVARNVRLNLLRSQRRQEAVAQELRATASAAFGDSLTAELPPALAAALAVLSPLDREVLLLHAWDELDRAGIAAAIGCSKANVSVRLHRARRRLQRTFEASGTAGRAPGAASITTSEGAADGC
jgi:RNA polymerase sigma-70 factor, ECF subfamily